MILMYGGSVSVVEEVLNDKKTKILHVQEKIIMDDILNNPDYEEEDELDCCDAFNVESDKICNIFDCIETYSYDTTGEVGFFLFST